MFSNIFGKKETPGNTLASNSSITMTSNLDPLMEQERMRKEMANMQAQANSIGFDPSGISAFSQAAASVQNMEKLETEVAHIRAYCHVLETRIDVLIDKLYKYNAIPKG